MLKKYHIFNQENDINIKYPMSVIGYHLCVFLLLFFHYENFFTQWTCHHCIWRASYFDQYFVLMDIEQWRFVGVPRLSDIALETLIIYCCISFNSGTVISCLNDLDLSRPGIEPRPLEYHATVVQTKTSWPVVHWIEWLFINKKESHWITTEIGDTWIIVLQGG